VFVVAAEYRDLQSRAFSYVLKFHAVVIAIELARFFWLEKPPADPRTVR
jgi:hypothetical protein